ncbi:alcohol dehydrogenase [Chryseobacterium sp. T16E-39]|uniref:NAD(P)-dependent alcohol dehydrogenase n=1 Tax=Chryseobacterium sp. T16E-39 TaxID=2015076 RepID=UPI000B5B170F|nr:NAD(P)-dependent alcohol dehydrogenase [Chryseobacterium sp. T16E-39]ASK31864.1 alcohol dehydrogenase [Chryseobacterium sp. T16E-39]
METIAAVIKEKGGDFVFENVTLDSPRENEVLVKIVATGICHTDIAARDNILGQTKYPIILGHEGSGIVESVGTGVTKVKKGDHVVLTFGYCGGCGNCENGLPAYCENAVQLNMGGSRPDGSHPHHNHGMTLHGNFFSQSSFATYSIATEKNVVKVPHDAPLELLGPLGCGIQTGAGAIINSLKVTPGKSVVISGAGAVGLAGVLAAKICGATTISVIDINAERLQLAKELGATHIVNSKEVDVTKTLLEIVPSGFHFAFDTTGRNEIVNAILASLRSLGICGIVGISKHPLELDMNSFMLKGLKLKGIIEGDSVPDDFIPSLVQLYQQGKFPFDKLIKTYAFKDINQAISDTQKGDVIKPVLLIN